MSIRMNQSFHRGKSLPAGQEDSKLQILSRQDMYFYYYEINISITMKLINENEVVNGGVTIILFLVCIPKKRNLSILFFEVSKKGCGNTQELLNGN